MASTITCSSVSIRLMFVVLLIGVGNAQLSTNFYSTTCPNLTSIISTAVSAAVSNESRMGASLLRLHFHDCFVNVSLFVQDFHLILLDNIIPYLLNK